MYNKTLSPLLYYFTYLLHKIRYIYIYIYIKLLGIILNYNLILPTLQNWILYLKLVI